MSDVVWSIDISSGQRVASARDYGALLAEVTGTGAFADLYPSTGPQTDLTRIARYLERGGVLFPVGVVHFDRATDTSEALATDATADNTITVDTPASFTVGEVVTVWRRSTNAMIAGARLVLDKTGSVLTLSGAAFVHAVGDLIITANEFGPLLDLANGGLWIPSKANVVLRWSGGLELVSGAQGDGAFLFMLGNSETSTAPRSFDVRARVGMTEAAAGQNSAIGVGWKSTSAVAGGGGLLVHSDGLGTWNRGAFAGNPAAPGIGFQATNPDVAPGVGDIFIDWHSGTNGDGINLSYDTRVHSRDGAGALVGNLNGGNSYSTTAVALTGLGAGATGPLTGVHALVQLLNGGSMTAVFKEFETHWVNA